MANTTEVSDQMTLLMESAIITALVERD